MLACFRSFKAYKNEAKKNFTIWIWSLTNVKQTVMMWRLFRGDFTGAAKIDPITRTTRHSLSLSVADKLTEIHYHFLNTLLCIADWIYPITSCLSAFSWCFNAVAILALNLLRSSMKWRVFLSMRLYLHLVKAIVFQIDLQWCVSNWLWMRRKGKRIHIKCECSVMLAFKIDKNKYINDEIRPVSKYVYALYRIANFILHRWNVIIQKQCLRHDEQTIHSINSMRFHLCWLILLNWPTFL